MDGATQHDTCSQLRQLAPGPWEGACLGGPLCTAAVPVPSTTVGGSCPNSMRSCPVWARTSLTHAGFFHQAGKLEGLSECGQSMFQA